MQGYPGYAYISIRSPVTETPTWELDGTNIRVHLQILLSITRQGLLAASLSLHFRTWTASLMTRQKPIRLQRILKTSDLEKILAYSGLRLLHIREPMGVLQVEVTRHISERPQVAPKVAGAPTYQNSSSPIYSHTLKSNEFRLLHLSPPLADGPRGLVHADLTTFSHDDCPEYETVSYTWGGEDNDSTLCKPVFIVPYWDILLQTRNCWAMLKHMRPRSGERAIWVDAICINQGDSTERENQVAKMSQIYEEGLRVRVFLGEDVLRPNGNASYPPRKNLSMLPRRNSMRNESSGSDNTSHFTLENILKRRYFSRTWVVQELILSRQAIIRIGRTEYIVDHHTNQDIANDRSWDWQSTAAPWFQHITQRSLTRGNQQGLLETLRLTWDCNCADMRDRVFGILGLVQTDNLKLAIRPDYSISVQHAFIGIFAHCLINLGDTRVLSAASGIDHWGYSLTWVPSWKSKTTFPEPADFDSEMNRTWTLQWKTDSVTQIERKVSKKLTHTHSIFDSGFKSLEEARYYSARGWWTTGYVMVQFIPVVGASIVVDTRNIYTANGTHEERLWHHMTSVSTKTGVISIPLARLLCLRTKPTLVSQTADLACYCIYNNSDSVCTIMDLRQPYLFFTARAKDLYTSIIPGRDYFFVLDHGSSSPLFLILRETEISGEFLLVTSCERLYFTHISDSIDAVEDIQLQDICRKWNLSSILVDVVSGSFAGEAHCNNIERQVKKISDLFFGTLSFRNLVAISKFYHDGEGILEFYLSHMYQYQPERISEVPKRFLKTGPSIDLELISDRSPTMREAGVSRFDFASSDREWWGSIFDYWRYKGGTWKSFDIESPTNLSKDVCIRIRQGRLLRLVREALKALHFCNNLGSLEIAGLEAIGSSSTQWTIPSLPGSLFWVSEALELDGNSYQIEII